MTKPKAIEFVIESLTEFLKRSEIEDVPAITPRSLPIGDLGLQSQDGIHWICDVEDSLGIEVAGDENPFLDKGRTRPNNVEQIANWIVRVCGEGGSNG